MGADQSSQARGRPYRSNKRDREGDIELALELLSDNDFNNLSHQRFPGVKGTPSWAKIGEYAVAEIKRELATARSEDELFDAVHHARSLAARLQARDHVKGARTTQELRLSIKTIASLATALGVMQKIRSGKMQPDHDIGAGATTLRQRWVRLGIADNPWIKTLMEQTVATVLAGNASPGIKAFFTRALTPWLPQDVEQKSGTKVEWDDF